LTKLPPLPRAGLLTGSPAFFCGGMIVAPDSASESALDIVNNLRSSRRPAATAHFPGSRARAPQPAASAATRTAATGGEASRKSARRSVAGRLTRTGGRNRHEVCRVTDKADRARQGWHFAVFHLDSQQALNVAYIGAFERSREGP